VSRARPRILLPWAASRAGLLIVGLLASRLLVSGLTLQKGNLLYHTPGPAALEIWARWDAEWYLLIADHGYRSEGFFLGSPVAYDPADATGFFPLYPLLIRAAGFVGLPALAAGVLISNLALLGALWFLRDLLLRDFGAEIAAQGIWVLLAFPTGFFLSAVYAESTLLCGVLGALWASRSGRAWLAGGLGAVAVLARPTGVLVLIPLAWEAMAVRPAGRRGLFQFSTLGPLAMPLLALGAFMIYCHAAFGEYAPFIERQARWRHPMSWPWTAFVRYFQDPHIHDAHHSTIDFMIAALCVASIPMLFRELPRSYALYGSAAILLPLCSTLWSFSRFAATLFPVHMLLAIRTGRSEGLSRAYFVTALPLAGLFMALYAAWWWVG
jgi:Mannosyltransferase (PIG-V)